MLSAIIILFALSLNAFRHTPVPNVIPMPLPALNSSQGAEKLADEENIREVVFRYQFEHNSSGQQQRAKIYFLSLNKGLSPGNGFMSRFRDHKPPVKKVSAASVSARGVVEKKTGRQGLVFRITGIKWLGENEVEVEGGYFESGHSASSNLYKVSRENGNWVVKEDKVQEIS